MHIPKLLLATAFLAAMGAGSIYAQRTDSDTQAKARAALDAALNAPASNTAPAEPAPAPPPAQPAPPPPAPAPVPTAPPPQPSSAPIVAPTAVTPAPVATAPPQPPVTAPPPEGQRTMMLTPPPAAAVPAAPMAAAARSSKSTKVQADSPLGNSEAPANPNMSSGQEDQVRSALGGGSSSSTMAPATQWQTPASAPAMAGAAPAESAPPDSREAALSELLMLYKADKISPAEYQARRAKILSGQ